MADNNTQILFPEKKIQSAHKHSLQATEQDMLLLCSVNGKIHKKCQ